MAEARDLYFDSALIAKFYLNEPGREAVRELCGVAQSVSSSAIAIAEVSAAFHRKYREGAIDAAVWKALNGQFSHDLKAGLWTLAPVSDVVMDGVRTLFAGLGPAVYLRSLDALHLVTAKLEKFEQLYTNDRHLLEGCAKAGLHGTNPLA